MKRFLFALFFGLSFVSLAQEQLTPLAGNIVLQQKESSSARFANTQFWIDTLELPFLDDFSSVKLHRYCNSGNLVFLDTSYARFRENGEIFDTLFTVNDTSFSYYYNSISQQIDTVPNLEYAIEEYNATGDTVIGIIPNFWPAFEYYYTDGALVSSTELAIDSVFLNIQSPIYIAYDSTSLWVNNDVFINNTFAVNPVTIGVATFDGIDSLGHPYNINNENSYGIADELTSKPINLAGKQNVILSFYYQPQGLGNEPEEEDSLSLEVFLPDTISALNGSWKHLWSVEGTAQKEFTYVEIPFTDSLFLQKGVKIRFKNYATLSGSLDHWNLDYVYLNDDRVLGDTAVNDLGFKAVETSFINTYQAMPYVQYKVNPAKYMKTELGFTLLNRSTLDLQGDNTYTITDKETNTNVFTSTITETNFINFPIQSTLDFAFPVNSAPYNFSFPSETSDEKTYEIQIATHSNTIESQELNFSNDSVNITQTFGSYYAYDDATPERGYSLIGASASMAYRFELEEADTITALLVHIPEMFTRVENSIRVKVWSDASGFPNDTLYAGPWREVFYETDSVGVGFNRYEIERLTIVPAGAFYIGFEQLLSDPVYVGFDMNNNTQSEIFYNTDGFWSNTSFEGSLMLRPDFGNSNLKPIYSLGIENEQNEELRFYPNPANSEITIENAVNQSIKIYNTTGSLVLYKIATNNTINISQIPVGVYQLFVGDLSTRLIISR